MKIRSKNAYEIGSAGVAWGVLGSAFAGILFFQSSEKSVPVPSATQSPVSRFMLEQLPVREAIQPKIIPEPESKTEPKPEPEIIPKPKSEIISEPEQKAIEELPPPEEPKEEPLPKLEPIPEPVAVAQEASTVEGGGNPVPPSLIRELQKMVEKSKYYPSRARRSNITGVAILRLTITPSGIIQKAEVLSADHQYLAAGAKRTGTRLVGEIVSSSPSRTIAVEVPIRYELR